MRIIIQKTKEREDAKLPNHIPLGYTASLLLKDDLFTPPKVGERFPKNHPRWSTSAVQEIINDRTFKTLNSVYTWEVEK